jgi:hypothetical protein
MSSKTKFTLIVLAALTAVLVLLGIKLVRSDRFA